jgi:CHASE3 domain sensor protein
MSHLTPEETARIKEEQRVRTGETVKTVAKMYFTLVGIVIGIIGILVLVCVLGIVFLNLNTR